MSIYVFLYILFNSIIELDVYNLKGKELDGVMKSTGMVRKVDELGRVVIPIELRRSLGIKEKDAIEIFVDGDQIVLKKYVPNMACHITGENTNENIALANGKIVLSPEGAKSLLNDIKKNFNLD